MASGVFGTPITEETVRLTCEYQEPITQKDVADYTLKMMSAGGKDADALKYVDNLKSDYGNGISAKCLIYNASGTTVSFADAHADWHGHIYSCPYPAIIHNGQWGAYLHVHPSGVMAGSAGAVVYRSKIPSSSSNCDWMFGWDIPYVGGNTTYTEIREQGHFPPHWDYIYNKKLEYGVTHSEDNNYGYRSVADIGQGTTVEARVIFEYPY